MNVTVGNLNGILVSIYIIWEDNRMLYNNDRNNGGVENTPLIIPNGHFYIIYLIWRNNSHNTIPVVDGR